MSVVRVNIQELPLSAIPLSAASCHFWPPRPTLSSTCRSKAVLTPPLACSICPYQRSLLSFRMKLIGSGGDNVLQLEIADLSDHCPDQHTQHSHLPSVKSFLPSKFALYPQNWKESLCCIIHRRYTNKKIKTNTSRFKMLWEPWYSFVKK